MLECRDLAVSFDGVAALDGATLSVPGGSVTAVMGPSGCGKSTLLRTIAGLQRPDSGSVLWNGQDLAAVPAHRRRFGLMFQDYALFPHLDVTGNVAFGLRMQQMSPPATADRVDEVLELVGMSAFAERSIDDLSGGEQQRVALARTLAPRPELLLLDEPLGALDRALRTRLLAEMRSILVDLGRPALYVTHDTDEAFGIADRVAVMVAGRMVQEGSSEELWSAPVDAVVATLLGHPNVVDAAALELVGGVAKDGSLIVPTDAISLDTSAQPNATVIESRFASDHYDVTAAVGAVELIARSETHWERGSPVAVRIDTDRLIELGREGAVS